MSSPHRHASEPFVGRLSSAEAASCHPYDTLHTMFRAAAQECRAALIGYLPAGFPTIRQCHDTVQVMVDHGCDLVEVGLPLPSVLDGPVVRSAANQAAVRGATMRDVWATVERVAASGGRAMVLACWEPLQQYGLMAFVRDLANAGGLGAITPDLDPRTAEAQMWNAITAPYLARTYLVGPDTRSETLAAAATASTGWIYAATGRRTGGHSPAHEYAYGLVAQLREQAAQRPIAPIALGFGVRTRQHATAMARIGDGVITGTALVEAAKQGLAAVAHLTDELAQGVREGGAGQATGVRR